MSDQLDFAREVDRLTAIANDDNDWGGVAQAIDFAVAVDELTALAEASQRDNGLSL